MSDLEAFRSMLDRCGIRHSLTVQNTAKHSLMFRAGFIGWEVSSE